MQTLLIVFFVARVSFAAHEGGSQEHAAAKDEKTRIDYACVKDAKLGWQPKATWSGAWKGKFQKIPYGPLGKGGMSKENCEKAIDSSSRGIICTNTLIGWKPTHFSGHTKMRADYGYYGVSMQGNQGFENCLRSTRFASAKGVCYLNDPNWLVGDLSGNTPVSGMSFPSQRACLEAVSPGWDTTASQLRFPFQLASEKNVPKKPNSPPHYSEWATRFCTQCHAPDKGAQTFPEWATDEDEMAKALEDPGTRKEAKDWVNKMHKHLVELSDMPPPGSKNGSLMGHEVGAKFVAFIKKTRLTLGPPNVTKYSAGQVVSAAERENYGKLLPHLASAEIEKALREGIPYDGNSIPVAYQDTSRSVYGVRGANARTVLAIKHFTGGEHPVYYDAQTGKLKFWSHGAGMDGHGATLTYNILSLPDDGNGTPQKIQAWMRNGVKRTDTLVQIEDAPKWFWRFPLTTISAENLYATDSGKKAHVLEVRTRTKTGNEPTDWDPNIFRPFPTKEDLLAAFDEVGAKLPELAEECAKVKEETLKVKLSPVVVDKEGFHQLPTIRGYTFKIPKMSEPLVKALLKDRLFKSTLGAVFASEGDKKAYAATTDQAFGIVPQNCTQGAIEVSKKSCNRCHDRANQPLSDQYEKLTMGFAGSAYHRERTQGYGNTPGNDGNLRWHPFSPQKLVEMGRGAALDNREVREEFKPLVDWPEKPAARTSR